MTKVAPSSTESMQAVHVTAFCAQGAVADTLVFGALPAPPAPVKAEVLVGIRAACVNVDDVAILQDSAAGGWFYHARSPTAARPLVGGCDYAGVVLQCGPDCTRLKVGDRVCGVQAIWMEYYQGTWAEQVVLPETDCVPLAAADISFVDAAALAMGAITSGDMYKKAALTAASGAKCRCLVIGASGGLGTVLLSLLRHHKEQELHVTAVCSAANAAVATKAGADAAVDYALGPLDQQLAGETFDVVFDFVGGGTLERSAAKLLKRGGQFITAVGPTQFPGDRQLSCCEWTGSACAMLRHGLRCCGRYSYTMAGAMPPLSAENFQPLLDAGARAEIGLEVPFAEASIREAVRRAASHHPGGKVVINLERRE